MPILHQFKKIGPAPRIVLIGNFGATNAGDELILAGFLRKLVRDCPRARVTVLGYDPQVVRQWHGVMAERLLPFGLRSLLAGRLRQTVKVLREADAVIFPGGGLFTDTESIFAVILWGLHLLLARYYWRPVYLLGQSVGPFRTELMRKLSRFVLSKAEWIGVRDQASRAELISLGIATDRIKEGRDSASFLVSKPPKAHTFKKKGVLKVLVSLRQFSDLPDSFFTELARAFDWLTEEHNARITFVPFQTLVSDDRQVWQEVCLSSSQTRHWKIAELPKSAEGVLQTVGQFDLVIGMRLHSLIAAHLTGVPSIALSYSRKVSEFQRSIGRGNTILETQGFDAKKFQKVFEKIN